MNKRKPQNRDFTFILSLVVIIILAIYFGADFFRQNNVLTYLDKTGKQLFEKIADNSQREKLETRYQVLLDKISRKEIAPADVEVLTASLVNLRQIERQLNEKEVQAMLESAIASAVDSDNETIFLEEEEAKKWQELDKRVKNIERFEYSIEQIQDVNAPDMHASVFLIDDSLHVIVDNTVKEVLQATESKENISNIVHLEESNSIVWSGDVQERIKEERQKIRRKMQGKSGRVRVSTAVATSPAITSDSIVVLQEQQPVEINPTPEPPQTPQKRRD